MALWKRPRSDESPRSPDRAPPDPAQIVEGYHQRSKHHPQRFAAALGYLDWDSQPDPFRRFAGAPRHQLGRPRPSALTWDALLVADTVTARPLDASSLSHVLFHSLALSAWKRFDKSRWALRVNPSSGNLHPTEGYLLLAGDAGLEDLPAVYHYAPEDHALELRARLQPAAFAALGLPAGSFAVALTSIPWRESWKYGERAWRYCQHDLGHAVGALRLAAGLVGWRLDVLPNVDDGALGALLGLDRPDGSAPDEVEVPALLAVVRPPGVEHDPWRSWPVAASRAAAASASWFGQANALSSEHHAWDVIAVVEQATAKTLVDGAPPWMAATQATPTTAPESAGSPGRDVDAETLIRGRRSAVAMDGRSTISRQAFVRLLARCLPDPQRLPWDALPWTPVVHLLLFVHRVDDLAPGLYLLVRDAAADGRLRAALADRFAWERPEGVPDELPLVRLASRDLRATAAGASCSQEIAGDGAFSLGMLAEFAGPLARHGAPVYRHLFWETGLLGQLLYLEAEAAGLRATGIGCFFDDVVHGLCGVSDVAFQSLYHFTVGGAVDDSRLTTEPAYPDLSP